MNALEKCVEYVRGNKLEVGSEGYNGRQSDCGTQHHWYSLISQSKATDVPRTVLGEICCYYY